MWKMTVEEFRNAVAKTGRNILLGFMDAMMGRC